jgi:hypothetical protein
MLMRDRSRGRSEDLEPPAALMGRRPSRLARRASSVRNMEAIVLRVRLISGDSMDVTYEDRDAGSEGEVIEHVVSTMSEASGVLRCRHGERLVVLYARGVAAVEVAPRGAVL